MRKLVFVSSMILVVTGLSYGQEHHTLTIDVSGIKKVKGRLAVCLLTDPKEFLADCSDYSEVAVNAETLSFKKEAVKPGKYVVSLYHDANGNGKLDTNFFRIPKERYGFSNNPRSAFGPPSYEKCLFEVSGDTRISIKLK